MKINVTWTDPSCSSEEALELVRKQLSYWAAGCDDRLTASEQGLSWSYIQIEAKSYGHASSLIRHMQALLQKERNVTTTLYVQTVPGTQFVTMESYVYELEQFVYKYRSAIEDAIIMIRQTRKWLGSKVLANIRRRLQQVLPQRIDPDTAQFYEEVATRLPQIGYRRSYTGGGWELWEKRTD